MRRPNLSRAVRQATGVPRGPSLPDARSVTRRAVGIRRPTARRRPVQDDDSTSGGAPTGSPYDDPSRDVGEGPDELTRTQSFVLLVGVLIAIYLLSATCGTAHVEQPTEHSCHVCDVLTQEYE